MVKKILKDERKVAFVINDDVGQKNKYDRSENVFVDMPAKAQCPCEV